MAHAGEKRTAEVALGDSAGVKPDDGTWISTRSVLERWLGKHLYWRLGPLDRYDSFPVKRIFPWGVPREIWELIARILSKKDLDALALVSFRSILHGTHV